MKKTIRKAFKFRLTPNSNQVQKMVEFAGAHRFVWNKLLAKNLALLAQKTADTLVSRNQFLVRHLEKIK